jgi:hypothetical protein
MWNFFFSPLLPPSATQTPSVSKRAHNTHFSSLLPFRIRLLPTQLASKRTRRKMDINPAGGGDWEMERRWPDLEEEEKKKLYIYIHFYSPFFFLLLLPS